VRVKYCELLDMGFIVHGEYELLNAAIGREVTVKKIGDKIILVSVWNGPETEQAIRGDIK